MFSSVLVAAAKFLVATTKILSVVPNFVAVTKPFFPCRAIETRDSAVEDPSY